VLESKYIRAGEEDTEMEECVAGQGRIHTWSRVFQSPYSIPRASQSFGGAGWVAQLEVDIAQVVPEDWALVNETVPEVALRGTMMEDPADPGHLCYRAGST
jgi:hypothetical protein